jgi:hypothetical protein
MTQFHFTLLGEEERGMTTALMICVPTRNGRIPWSRPPLWTPEERGRMLGNIFLLGPEIRKGLPTRRRLTLSFSGGATSGMKIDWPSSGGRLLLWRST